MGTETERLVALSRIDGYERHEDGKTIHVGGYDRKGGMLGRLRSAFDLDGPSEAEPFQTPADNNPWKPRAIEHTWAETEKAADRANKGGTGNPWDELDLDPDHDGDVDAPGEPDRDHAEEAETHLTRALKSLRAHRDSAIRQNVYQAMVPEDDGL